MFGGGDWVGFMSEKAGSGIGVILLKITMTAAELMFTEE